MLTEEAHFIHFDKLGKNLNDFLSWWFFSAYFNVFQVEFLHLILRWLSINFSLASEVQFVSDNDSRHVFVELIALDLFDFFYKIFKWILIINGI